MLLAVDVGNSQTVIGVFDGDELAHHWRISTDAERTPDELALLFGGLLRYAGLDFTHNVHGLIVSSVVPVVTEMLRVMAHKYFPFPPLVVGPGVRTGMSLAVDNPREVGADRLVTALAAHHEHGGPGVVVDFGTATSFDVYSADGRFVGGVIAPGVATSIQALSARGAQLPRIELATPDRAIGRNTVDAMRAGGVYGFAGAVDRIIEEVGAELAETDPVVVATGGLAPSVFQACRRVHYHDAWLTLKGLRVVWERNT
ncbi:MAG: type III pantothenate kinase [Actinobacteria bacterium QS_5_72_10]|nr:MAG: type III pantothenate kinase [Actinobacteria bacterium QS_5_72_10]